MVQWDIERLGKELGEDIIQRFHLAGEREQRLGDFKNIASIKDGVLSADYFSFHFQIRFKKNGGEYLNIEISSTQRGIEELVNYTRSHIETGRVFSSTGILSSIGQKREFKKYSERLEYIEAREEVKETTPTLCVSYKINNEKLPKLNHNSFKETISDYAIRPFFSWALVHRSK